MNRCSPVLDVATIPFPVVFWSFLPPFPLPMLQAACLGRLPSSTFALVPTAHPAFPGLTRSFSTSSPQIPGAFRAIWCVFEACFCIPVPLRSVALCLIPPSVDSFLRCSSLQTSLAKYFEIRSSQTTKSRGWRRSHRKVKPGIGTRVLQS